ncbi:hypothetical protein [Actinocrispum sp. NPDC049592]|uniref:sialidase family protein n=1 Tax=Actinocrispum sp. NPDC049592 TaxID=3154835 RepID=UPI00342863AF
MAARLRNVKPRVLLAVLAGVLILSTPARAAPGGFLASSIAWLDAADGAVFGYGCGTEMCPQLRATSDGGATWRTLAAPDVKLPDNHNQVKLTLIDHQIGYITDGTSLWATTNGSRSWDKLTFSGVADGHFIGKVVVAHGHVYVMVHTYGEDGVTQLYESALGRPALRPKPGYAAAGAMSYGDIAVDGDVIQVYLGADLATAVYGYSTDGRRFTGAPLPCPVDNFAILAGIRDGHPIALCNSGGGSPSPGHMMRQVWMAPQLGGEFGTVNPAPALGITSGFGAASADDFVIAAVGGDVSILHTSFDGGKSWDTRFLSERGFGIYDLGFVTGKIGYLIDGQPDTEGGSVVYRTADGGHTWNEFTVDR